MTTLSYALLNHNYEIIQLLFSNKDFVIKAKTKELNLKSGHFFINEKTALKLIAKEGDFMLF